MKRATRIDATNNMAATSMWVRLVLYVAISLLLLITTGAVYRASTTALVADAQGVLMFTLCLFSCLVLILAALAAFRLLDRLDKKLQLWVSVGLFAVFAVVSFVLMAAIDVRPNTDALTDIDTGWYLQSHAVDEGNKHIGWLNIYPNNYALILLFAGLARATGVADAASYMRLLVNINWLCLFVGLLFAYLAAREATDTRGANKALVLMVANPLYYLLIFWVYSISLSMPLIMGIVFVIAKLDNTPSLGGKALLCIPLGILIALGYELRLTSVFPLIAYVVLCLVRRLGTPKDKRPAVNRSSLLRGLICAGVVAVCALVPIRVINGAIHGTFAEQMEHNYPAEYWLVMGSHGNGDLSTNEDDTGYELSLTPSMSAQEQRAEYWRAIIHNYRSNGIVGTLNLWYRKMIATFSDAFSGVANRAFMGTFSGYGLELLRGPLGACYAYAYRIAILVGMLASCWYGLRNRQVGWLALLSLITMLGAIVFYFMWEAKGDYVLPFMLVMSLVAADGYDAWKRARYPMEVEKVTQLLPILASLTIGLCLGLWSFLAQPSDRAFNRIDGRTLIRSDDDLPISLEGGQALSQTFVCAQPFNRIMVDAAIDGGEEPPRLTFTLKDSTGEVLFESMLQETAYDTSSTNGSIVLDTGTISSSDGRYELVITNKEDKTSGVTLYTGDNYLIDSYAGTLTVGDTVYADDLSLVVEDYGSRPALPTHLRVAFVAGLCAVYLAILWATWRIAQSGQSGADATRPRHLPRA